MSYAQLQSQSQFCNQTGGRWTLEEDIGRSVREWTGWQGVWGALRSSCYWALTGTSGTLVVWYLDRLPIAHKGHAVSGETAKSMLKTIEDVFGPSASDMARILNVSRPMVYHYRGGMEPDLENRRRLQTISEIASEFRSSLTEPLTGFLKVEQPEGRTLLDVLSEERLDVPAVRRIVQRNVKAADEALRYRFAEAMMKGQTAYERLDIIRERHKAGKPVVVSDPQSPGKLIQILPNGRRIRGRMVKRRFVPDEK